MGPVDNFRNFDEVLKETVEAKDECMQLNSSSLDSVRAKTQMADPLRVLNP